MEGENPVLILRGTTTKNRKGATFPLHPELVKELLSVRPVDFESAKLVIEYLIPRPNGRWKKDLEAMGIAYRDNLGRDLDFHSLRHTYVTMCGQVSTSSRAVQELARHSSPNLTVNIYTDTTRLELRDTIDRLPNLLNNPKNCTPICTQKPDGSTSKVGDMRPFSQHVPCVFNWNQRI